MSSKETGPTIESLYPNLNEQQVEIAEENFRRYLELVLRIYERIRDDPDAYARFRALTGKASKGTMKVQRSNLS